MRLIASLAAIDTINASWLNIQQSLDASGVLGTLLAVGGISAVVWLALFATLVIAREESAPRPLRFGDYLLIAIMTGAALIPAPLPAAGAVLLAAIYLLIRPGSRRERRIGYIFLAPTGTLIWGRLLLEVIAPTMLLGLDAQFVSLLSGTAAHGNSVRFSDGRYFLIAPDCSSLNNMSLAVLMWVTAVQLFDLPANRRVLATGTLAMLAMLLVNGLRLAAIALHPAEFAWLHTGFGATLFGWASLLLCGATVWFGLYGVSRRLG